MAAVCALFLAQPACVYAISPQARCEALSTTPPPTADDIPARITEAAAIEDTAGGDHCRIRGYLAPQIGFEIWLPTRNWNHKLIEFGCGGFCGSTNAVESCPLTLGYACIATDSGHQGTMFDAAWAHQNWQAKLDWGYRAPHLVAVFGKVMVARYFGARPTASYFLGASNGGRQALIETQRFPSDFAGVVALAPPVDIAQTFLTWAWSIQASHDANGKALLSDTELKLLTRHAIHQCGSDGVDDQIVANPIHCNFDPADLLCGTGSHEHCLTAAQVAAARKIYRGPVDESGTPLTLGGPLPGSEFVDGARKLSGWRKMFIGNDDQEAPFASPLLLLVSDGLCHLFLLSCATDTATLSTFDFARNYRSLRDLEPLYDAGNPDLRAFRDNGGKLIIVQGLSDPIVSPLTVIDYYQAVERAMGGRQATEAFVRLFLLPGVEHGGGSGADVIDLISAIDSWVAGRPPEKLIAARIKDCFSEPWQSSKRDFQLPVDRAWLQFTRPVYPYPTRVRYRGKGDVNDAESFAPIRGP